MNTSTKNEVLEALESARNMMIDEEMKPYHKIGSKENPFVLSLSIARAMKTDYNSDIWVSIYINTGMKVCQLKDLKE